MWAISSVGRAPALQAGGHWFEPGIAHHSLNIFGNRFQTTSVTRTWLELVTPKIFRKCLNVLLLFNNLES